MQATINYIYTQDTTATKANPAATLLRKEATTKIVLFAAILACLALAVNI